MPGSVLARLGFDGCHNPLLTYDGKNTFGPYLPKSTAKNAWRPLHCGTSPGCPHRGMCETFVCKRLPLFNFRTGVYAARKPAGFCRKIWTPERALIWALRLAIIIARRSASQSTSTSRGAPKFMTWSKNPKPKLQCSCCLLLMVTCT